MPVATAERGKIGLPRRLFLAGTGTVLAGGHARCEDVQSEWGSFKQRFVTSDGRVLDTANDGVSHTESQAWGMLFAEHHDDPAVFARIWEWTDANLRRPDDALYSWRYDPAAPVPVADRNNATDGDLFIAMALSRAARRWNKPAYADRATALGQEIVRRLVRVVGTRTVLLPGCDGFESPSDLVLNPSYYVFPAIRELATRAPSPVWADLLRDGEQLLSEARFGRWRLTPDWLQLDLAGKKMAPAVNWAPRFSFDAIRVPLYLAWARVGADTQFREFAGQFLAKLPAWVDLNTDQLAPYAAPPGMQAVAMFAAARSGDPLPATFPSVADAPDYYSAALTLLVRLAWNEAFA